MGPRWCLSIEVYADSVDSPEQSDGGASDNQQSACPEHSKSSARALSARSSDRRMAQADFPGVINAPPPARSSQIAAFGTAAGRN
jgi:hypothetical protein